MRSNFTYILACILSLNMLFVSGADGSNSQGGGGISIFDANIEVQYFLSNLERLQMQISQADQDDVEHLKDEMWKVGLKWDICYFNIESLALNNEELLDGVVEVNNKVTQTRERLETCEKFWESSKRYEELMGKLEESKSHYERLEMQAQKLSLAEQTASELEELKAAEQMTFSTVERRFNEANIIVEEFPEIDAEGNMEQLYSQILILSDNVKAAEYIPLLDRMKEYLYNLAAVAILLMFASMIQTKIAAAKALKENAKSLEKLKQNRGTGEHPLM